MTKFILHLCNLVATLYDSHINYFCYETRTSSSTSVCLLCSQLPRWLNLTWIFWADCSWLSKSTLLNISSRTSERTPRNRSISLLSRKGLSRCYENTCLAIRWLAMDAVFVIQLPQIILYLGIASCLLTMDAGCPIASCWLAMDAIESHFLAPRHTMLCYFFSELLVYFVVVIDHFPSNTLLVVLTLAYYNFIFGYIHFEPTILLSLLT
jgi:hypothetical protein